MDVTPEVQTESVSNRQKKKQVHPIVVGILFVCLIGFIGKMYVMTFGMPRFGKLKPVGEVVIEVVTKTNGDITKVSKEDMDHINDLTMGNGEKYYKTYAKKLKESNGKPITP